MGRSTVAIIVARIGGPRSYSDTAAKKMFGDAKILLCDTFEKCLAAVRDGRADYAVVPVNNKASGDISEVDSALTVKQAAEGMGLRKTHELSLPICHVLASNRLFKDVRIVISRQQATDQCTKFLKQRRLEIRTRLTDGTPVPDTSAAAKYVAEHPLEDIAAICSPEAAKKYGLDVIHDGNIADVEGNYTIFYAYAAQA